MDMSDRIKEESKSSDDIVMVDSQTVVTPTKKAKLNCSGANDSETEGQSFFCQ